MVGFEKALGAVIVIKDQIQYRSQSLLNLAHRYFSFTKEIVIVIFNWFNVPVLQKEFIMSKQFDLSMRINCETKYN